MTIADVVNRISSLVASPPFEFERAKEPFSFDLQPQQRLHRAYCVESGSPRDLGGLIGFQQAEIVPITVRLARLVQRDANAAYLAMLTDVGSLQAAFARDGVLGDYNADVEDWRVQPPEKASDFIVAELLVLTDYERAL